LPHLQYAQTPDAMKLLLFGNMGAGKTTLAKAMLRALPSFSHWAIDDCRRRHGDGTMEGERRAKEAFLSGILPGKCQLIEASGLGDLGASLARRMAELGEPAHVLLLHPPLGLCLERMRARVWDIPFPAPTSAAFDIAAKAHQLFEDGAIERLWADVPQAWLQVWKAPSADLLDGLILQLKKDNHDEAV
jgi:energy-coupling factor transporter ATP-binding protein EcfA2